MIGIAVGTVLLPEMANRIASGDEAGARHAQNRAIELTLLLSIPCLVAFLLVPDLIMRALFVRGAFTAADAGAAAATLAAYAIGLLPFVLLRSVTVTFLSRGDTATPVKALAVAVVVNVALKLLLYKQYAQVGLAFATSIGAWINFGLLIWFAARRDLLAIDDRLKARPSSSPSRELRSRLRFILERGAFRPCSPDGRPCATRPRSRCWLRSAGWSISASCSRCSANSGSKCCGGAGVLVDLPRRRCSGLTDLAAQRTLAGNERDQPLPAVAPRLDLDRAADLVARQHTDQVVRAGDRRAVERQDDVARRDPRAGRPGCRARQSRPSRRCPARARRCAAAAADTANC